LITVLGLENKEKKMEKAIIVYWSSTGNTEAMANAIADGVKAAGGTPELVYVDNVNVDELLAQPAFAIGCPAMGAEELDESVDSFVSEIEGKVSGKNILLFGSYDWGDGEWMRLWVERMQNAGANIIGGEGIIANLEPDADAKAALEAAGKQLAAF
jgi:flavodoxin